MPEKWVVKKGKVFWPSEEMKKRAWISDEKIYKIAEKNPIKFWSKLAAEGITWFKKWKTAYVSKPPYFKWFVGGKLNASYNCLDRHVETWKKNKVAIIWEPEPLEEKERIFTYHQLYKEVNKFANVLKDLGVKKGDRVTIYLPMIPEVHIAMLACTRIGAIHSVVFSAFSSEALKARITDAEAKVLITADGYYRRGQVVNLKASADEAVKGTSIEKVVVVKRAGNEVNMQEGRDFWWHELMKKAKSYCKPEVMDAEDLMFILYTSGSTGKPKGVCHSTGGYLTQAYWTAKWDFDLHDEDIFWCVPGDTLVICNPVPKPISSITIGDKVLTHLGKFEAVDKIFCRRYKGKMVKIYTLYSNKSLLLTPNHRILVLRKRMPIKVEWVKAKDLKVGDHVAFPRIRKNRIKKDIRISKVVENIKVENGYALPKKGKKGRIKDKIMVSPDFLRLVGYYIAEGCIAKDTIQLTFSKNEKKLVEDCSSLFNQTFGIRTRIFEYKGGLDLRVDSIILAKIFERLFGKHSFEKHLPAWVLTLPWNFLKEFIKGYCAGDGSLSRKRRRIRFTTTSQKLAYQLKLILNKLGIVVSLKYLSAEKIRKRQTGRKILSKHDVYELVVTGKSSKKLYSFLGVEEPVKSYTWQRAIITTNLIFFPITKKELVNYDGYVWNLKTNSGSYATSEIVVHNCTADVAWITGHSYACYGPLVNGATMLIYEGAPDWPNPDRWWEIIEKYGVTVFYTAPTAIRMFIALGEEWVKKHDLSSLRLLASVGEPIDEDAWMWYFNMIGGGRCPLIDTWWQTETGGTLINSLPGIGPFVPTFACRSFPGTRHAVLNEKGKPVKPMEKGSLVQLPPFAPGMLRGIWKNPEKYLETYWSKFGLKIYYTSDAAIVDKHGWIRIVGREDDVIKVAGHRIATGEIENALNLHEKVTESAVIGMPHKIKGDVPLAFVILKVGEQPSKQLEEELVQQVRKMIGPIAKPEKILFVEDLPKTRSGKIMRRILRSLLADQPTGDVSTLANPECVEKIKKILTELKQSQPA